MVTCVCKVYKRHQGLMETVLCRSLTFAYDKGMSHTACQARKIQRRQLPIKLPILSDKHNSRVISYHTSPLVSETTQLQMLFADHHSYCFPICFAQSEFSGVLVSRPMTVRPKDGRLLYHSAGNKDGQQQPTQKPSDPISDALRKRPCNKTTSDSNWKIDPNE